jgi:hypothetical protein
MDITYKTKKMVENGLVLDERGTWIPIIDKLKMERFFIDRLSSGEVLFDKRWVPISDAKAGIAAKDFKINTEKRPAEPEEKEPAIASESQKHNEGFAFNDFLNEEDHRPELDETNHSEISVSQCDTMIKEAKKEKAPSVDSLLIDYNEHETVVLPPGRVEELENVDDSLITARKASSTQKIPAVSFHENVEEILDSIEEFDEWEKKTRKHQALIFAIVSGIAAIVGSSAILALLLI